MGMGKRIGLLPGRQRIIERPPTFGLEAVIGHKAGIERSGDRFAVERCADEHQLLAPIAPLLGPVPIEQRPELWVNRPLLARHRRPPIALGLASD